MNSDSRHEHPCFRRMTCPPTWAVMGQQQRNPKKLHKYSMTSTYLGMCWISFPVEDIVATPNNRHNIALKLRSDVLTDAEVNRTGVRFPMDANGKLSQDRVVAASRLSRLSRYAR